MSATFKRTKIASFTGVICQAVVSNLTAILFIPLMELYSLTYAHLGLLVAINFISQFLVDIIFSPVIDRVGYKVLVLPSCILAFLGLLFYALTPYIMPNNVLAGIIIATIIFAMSSGLMEVILSPLIMAIPEGDSHGATGFLHSFYAWGQVATIIITTLLLFLIGRSNWMFIAIMWSIVPLLAFFIFLKAPFPDIIPAHKRDKGKSILKSPFFIFALLAIFFGGASEVLMNQWSSTFMEKGLLLPKVVGDLVGMCGFSILFGISRTIYGFKGSKVNVNKIMLYGSFIAIFCYLGVALIPVDAIVIICCALCGCAVSLLWPGVIVSAGSRFPMAGAWIYAVLAIAGDLGAALGPMMTGAIADASINSSAVVWLASLLKITTEQASLRFAILMGTIFPIGAFVSNIFLNRFRSKPIKNLMNDSFQNTVEINTSTYEHNTELADNSQNKEASIQETSLTDNSIGTAPINNKNKNL